MDERCPGCEVKEKLKNLQVLRHIMSVKEKGSRAIGEKKRAVSDDKKGIGIAGGRKTAKR